MNDYSYFAKDEFEFIKKKLVDNMKKQKGLHEVSEPTLILLCGQPGAGKSNITKYYKEMFDNNIVTSDIDEYRELHPKILQIRKHYPNEWSQYCQEFASNMGKDVVNEFMKLNYNILIDGTMKNRDKTIKIINNFKEKGFKVKICAVATKPDISKMGIISRYANKLKQKKEARNVPMDIHDTTVQYIPNNLNDIQKENLVDSIYVFDRNVNLLYDSTTNKNELAGDIIKKIYDEPLTEKERNDIVDLGSEAFGCLTENETGISYMSCIKELFAKYAVNKTNCSQEILDIGVDPSKHLGNGSGFNEK